MYLDNHDYKNHDDLIIVTKNNHNISIFNDNCPTLIDTTQSDNDVITCHKLPHSVSLPEAFELLGSNLRMVGGNTSTS